MTDLREVTENVRTASEALRAYMRFHDAVAVIACNMAERGDSTCLLLLDAMKDLHASTSEFGLEEIDPWDDEMRRTA